MCTLTHTYIYISISIHTYIHTWNRMHKKDVYICVCVYIYIYAYNGILVIKKERNNDICINMDVLEMIILGEESQAKKDKY